MKITDVELLRAPIGDDEDEDTPDDDSDDEDEF